jgi:ornithine cyclodeaminase/alanine dehydrogenase-like protein (mu-crystallin family)
MRVLNRHDVTALLPMERCIALMRDALMLVSDQRAVQPIRRALVLPHGRGLVSLMPGYVEEPACFGVKVVSVYPGNHGTAHGSHQGAILLFDDAQGALEAVVDGRAVTAIRTAAASAAATDVLARRDAATLTICGYGDEAETHLAALTAVRDFERIVICGRSLFKAAAFAGTWSERMGRRIEASDDFEACANADVVTTVTAAATPFLLGRWLRPGTHLNVVGSSIPSTAEVDDEVVRRSRFFTDYTDSALELGGEIRGAIARGVVGADHILGCVGDVLTGKVAGRRSDDDITCFKSLGMVAEDLLSASFLLRAATAADAGTEVAW